MYNTRVNDKIKGIIIIRMIIRKINDYYLNFNTRGLMYYKCYRLMRLY